MTWHMPFSAATNLLAPTSAGLDPLEEGMCSWTEVSESDVTLNKSHISLPMNLFELAVVT